MKPLGTHENSSFQAMWTMDLWEISWGIGWQWNEIAIRMGLSLDFMGDNSSCHAPWRSSNSPFDISQRFTKLPKIQAIQSPEALELNELVLRDTQRPRKKIIMVPKFWGSMHWVCCRLLMWNVELNTSEICHAPVETIIKNIRRTLTFFFFFFTWRQHSMFIYFYGVF